MPKVERNIAAFKGGGAFQAKMMEEAPASVWSSTWVRKWGVLVKEHEAKRKNKDHSSGVPLKFYCCAATVCMGKVSDDDDDVTRD